MTESSRWEAKQQLRRSLRERRRQVSSKERASASREIARRLFELVDFGGVRALHVYRSVPGWGEVDTEEIVAAIGSRWPAVEIVSPDLSAEQPIPTRPFDLIVVPVLGFDRRNFRLGLGAGFYDRFLATQPDALKVGLAYDWARLDALPDEPHDIPLDLVITEVSEVS